MSDWINAVPGLMVLALIVIFNLYLVKSLIQEAVQGIQQERV